MGGQVSEVGRTEKKGHWGSRVEGSEYRSKSFSDHKGPGNEGCRQHWRSCKQRLRSRKQRMRRDEKKAEVR